MWNLLLSIQFEEDTIFTFVYLFPMVRLIKFPNCKGLYWFCNKTRFFAPEPEIALYGRVSYFCVCQIVLCVSTGEPAMRSGFGSVFTPFRTKPNGGQIWSLLCRATCARCCKAEVSLHGIFWHTPTFGRSTLNFEYF